MGNITMDSINNNNNLLPLEKIIEQIIIKTPLPISSDAQISISFKISNIKDLNTEKIKFPVFNIKEAYIKHYQSLSFVECFNYFSAEDILRIFKYMLLEIPLLFFSKDKGALTLFVDNFLTLLNPFVYILPHISILPNELYGLINSEQKFIFGINEEYSNTFFEDNYIDIDKSIVVICLNSEKKGESKIIEMSQKMELVECLVINEQNKKKENNKNTEESIFYNGNYINILNIDIPSGPKKKTLSSLNNLLSLAKKKSSDLLDPKNISEHNFDYKIKHIFFKFFIYIMSGYTDYLLNSKYFFSDKNTGGKNCCGNNIRFKNADEDFIKEVFDIKEFILSHSKDELFYMAFIDTKIFFNFF